MTSIACEVQKERLSLNPTETKDNSVVVLNAAYQTVKNHRTIVVYPVEVKKDSVVVKDSLDRKDSRTISLAQFLKFYNRS